MADIKSGEQLGNIWIKNWMKSNNYKPGAFGFMIDGMTGNVEFGNGYFRGDITGASGTFTGTITATTGSIGGWTISSTAIYFNGATDALSSGMASADYPFYAGKKYIDRATAPFRVTPDGVLVATGATITDGTITGGTIQTSATGKRVVMYNDKIEVYSSTGLSGTFEGATVGGYLSSFNVDIGTFTGLISFVDTPPAVDAVPAGSNGIIGVDPVNGLTLSTKGQAYDIFFLTDAGNSVNVYGNFDVGGTLTKGAGSFRIDHPLKPKTHYLQHSFTESPEMLNIYRNNDEIIGGECFIKMPDWFIPLNGKDKNDYSYQLTSIGQQNDLWVKKEMDEDGEIIFAGEKDGKFSYIITAIRHDEYAENHRIEVEIKK